MIYIMYHTIPYYIIYIILYLYCIMLYYIMFIILYYYRKYRHGEVSKP
jgi:hypothetical protein